MTNEIILYQSEDLLERIEEETVWLNRYQLALLFGRDIKTIGKHISNVFNEGELKKDATVGISNKFEKKDLELLKEKLNTIISTSSFLSVIV